MPQDSAMRANWAPQFESCLLIVPATCEARFLDRRRRSAAP